MKKYVPTDKIAQLIILQSKVSFFSQASVWLGIVLAIATVFVIKNFEVSLSVAAVLIVFGVVSRIVLKNVFVKNSRKIVEIFKAEYHITNAMNIRHIKNNVGLNNYIKSDDLLIYSYLGNVCFCSANMFQILNIKTYSSHYKNAINSDFGYVAISIDEIDNYRRDVNSTILTIRSEHVAKIELSSDEFFERDIPQKEYYFSTTKK